VWLPSLISGSREERRYRDEMRLYSESIAIIVRDVSAQK
jgi:hypothetical protein